MKLSTAGTSLLSLLSTATAKNYGPTVEQCDASDGIGCASDKEAKSSVVGPEKFHNDNDNDNESSKNGKKKARRKKGGDKGYMEPNPTKGEAQRRKEEEEGEEDEEKDWIDPGKCALYLAPSSLPHAGLGIFTGIAIPYDRSVNEYIGGTFPGYNDDEDTPLWGDAQIVIADKYKALPYRGQQRWPSWLQYIWPESPGALSDFTTKPFPVVPPQLWDFDHGLNSANGLEFYMDDISEDMMGRMDPEWQPTQRVNAFVPGLATLANSHEFLSNMDRMYSSSRTDYLGMKAPWQPGAGAFTPHHGIEFEATNGIREGMELLLNYGEEWSWKNDAKLDWIKAQKAEYTTNDTRERKGFVEGIHKKWDILDKRERDDCPEELPTEKGKRDRISEGMAADSSEFEEGERPYSEYRENDYLPADQQNGSKKKRRKTTKGDEDEDEDEEEPTSPDDITMPLPWLNANGVCLSSGKFEVGPSAIEHAGRGVFATTHIGKGEVVLPSPLLAMREEDFVIYKTDEDAKFERNVVDKSTKVGMELLYNYAFSHPDSPLYLVPTAPLANFINHGGEMEGVKPKSEGANVAIRWPKEGSNSAKLFEWAYSQKHGNHFDNDFENTSFGENNHINPWLKDHPIDVMERSGKLGLEYVALRDIHNGEEILIDYGDVWDGAWEEFAGRHAYARSGYFRHSLGVPKNFFPEKWLHASDKYEIAEIQDLENKPLVPGVALPMTWAHNGKPVSSKYAYVVGLEKGFSDKFLEYSQKKGVIELYRRLLTEQEGYHLPSDGFNVYKPGVFANDTSKHEFFAHRYHSDQWNFNMHFVAPWSQSARKDVIKALGDAGFDIALKAIGERFGYDNMTCFHGSYMGVTHCDKSKMHSDIYATDDKSWNMIFPLITVEGTDPELDIMSENMNTVIGVHYLKDIVYAMGDFGYHQTRPIAYYDPDDDSVDYGDLTADGVPIRVVFGPYCAQIDETNVAMLRHIYDGDDPAPFADQFKEIPMREIHWDKATGKSSLANPSGKGY